jgi:HlyD family secretion protein
MSVNATIETRTRTNAIAAPIASVTTRTLKAKSEKELADPKTNSVPTNAVASTTVTNSTAGNETNSAKADKKADDKNKPVDVVFIIEGDHVKTVPVKIGISDDNYWEITDGLQEGDEIVIGGYKAISHDLDDGKKFVKGAAGSDAEKPKS